MTMRVDYGSTYRFNHLLPFFLMTMGVMFKQFNGNFDTCICLVNLLPLYTSKMIMDQPGLWVYRIRIFNAENKR